MSTQPQRTCPNCGNELSAAMVFCPVCTLRKGLAWATEPGESSFEEAIKPTPVQTALRFEHYELATGEDGKPVELGRGAMGVTYKAFDIDLHRVVTLKVITEQYLGDESARLRFLREARAAASLRHPNVASVFHLGKTGENYFYAMEFVEGESLENLIRRSGRLEVKMALEIATQVAAGLAAVNKQKLVHRDIKPSNIMVNVETADSVTVKIIDLGLAKPAPDAPAEAAISTPGAFAGTPEFASPEQFTGLGVDIRSDLYSLGVVLWEMVTGHAVFRGSPAEVMYQHRDRSPPTEELKSLPQPAVVLLEVLLEKSPNRRFQTPLELLESIETVKGAIVAGRRMVKTIRVGVFAPSDVQKEQNLADRLMNSTAAEFSLPVSTAQFGCPRIVEEDLALQFDVQHEHRADHSRFVLCPLFSEGENFGDEASENELLGVERFDLIICIVWSRLGLLAKSGSMLGIGTVEDAERDLGRSSEFDDTAVIRRELGLSVYRNCNVPTPPLEPREDRDEFGRRWDAVQEFFEGWQIHSPNQKLNALRRYESLQEFEDLFRADLRQFLSGRLVQNGKETPEAGKMCRWPLSPFRGLNLFSFEHAPIFHGRTKAVGEVLEAMEAQRRVGRPFVIVVGASGSGKSSLIQAGVLPLLTQPGTISGIGLWRRAVTRPAARGSGGDCFDALAASLLEPTGLPVLRDTEAENAGQDLARELRECSDSVALRVRDALEHAAREYRIEKLHRLAQQERQLRGFGRLRDADATRQRAERIEIPKARLALVIDQLEELFTTGFSQTIRQRYVSTIADLVRGGRVFVLATLRSDFYPSYQQLAELVEVTRPSGKVDLRPPTPYEIGEMIRAPAEAAGLRFEEDASSGERLDEALRDAAAATPESLPLLEHVLSLLYDEQSIRGDGVLRWSDYRELGELKGALAQHAETVFGTLRTSEQSAFSLVMRYLVTLGQGEDEVPNRRTVPYRDFFPQGKGDTGQNMGAKGFVDLFVSNRLFVADSDPEGNVTVSVAHEALLREWKRVKEWLADNREFLRMRDRLDSSLKLWLSRGRQKDDLLGPGLPLAEGEKLVGDFAPSLNQEQTDYVNTSIAEQLRRKRIRDRVRYAVLASITAALVAAVIFGVVSFRQFRRAERAKAAANESAKRATVARSEAEKLINFMMTDLRDKVEPIGRLDLLDDVNRRVKSYYDTIARGDDGAEIQRQHSLALVNYGDVLFDKGAPSEAGKLYREALEITQKLTNQNPGDPNFRADLAAVYQQIGNVLESQGNVEEALKNYEESRSLREKLVEQSPQNSDWQRRLAWSLQKVGLMLKARGDLPGAQKNFVQALNVAGELHRRDLTKLDFLDALWILNIRVGEVLEAKGEPDGALNYYRDSLEVAQELKKDAPKDTNWQRYIGVSEEQIGNILMTEGDCEGAQGDYTAAFSVRSALFVQDQANGLWEDDLALSYEDLGSIAKAQGDLEKALKMYRECLSHRTRLTSRDATDSEAQQDFATSKNKFGLVLLASGQFPAALESCTEALQTAQMLAEKDGKNEEWQRDMAKAAEGVGEVLKAEDRSADALPMYQKALLIRNKLTSKDQRWKKEVAWNEEEIGDALMRAGDYVAASEHSRSAIRLGESLVAEDHGDIEVRSNLAKSYQGLGEALAQAGRQVEALQNLMRSKGIFEKLLLSYPKHADWESATASICLDLANCLSMFPDRSSVEIRQQLEQGRDILLEKQKRFALGYSDTVLLKVIGDRLH
jgi:tetratricopeptide (TPR) repeat protein/tRNA A-37 threonylcarbamoyl transferase component Bud32